MDEPLEKIDLKPLLMQGSISDILHDFGSIVSKTDIKDNVDIKSEIINGLPSVEQQLDITSLSEDDFVNSVIDLINGKKKNKDYDFNFVIAHPSPHLVVQAMIELNKHYIFYPKFFEAPKMAP